jgi:hypothetical protein
MHRTRILSLAVAATLLGASSAGHSADNAPKANLYMDVATHTMAGMPGMGGMGRVAMGLFGGRGGSNSYGMTRFPGMPGQYLDIALHNRLNPGKEAAQEIPTGLRLGASLPLLPPEAAPKVESAPQGADGKTIADGTTRILIYWGCGTEVRPGQPKVVSISAKNGKVDVSGASAMQGRYVPDRSISPDPSYALWPNPRSRKHVPDGASLVGAHHVVGDKVPESLKFDLAERQDFLPRIALSNSGELATGQTWNWQPVTRALGYYLYAMGQQGDALVLWSSSETPDAGMGIFDYLPNATVEKWVREKVLLAPSVTRCAIPKGIFAGKDGGAAGGMLQMIAFGPESNIAWPPRPADPKAAWSPEWNVRVRTKSTAMAMLGMDVAAADAEDAEGAEPAQDESKAKKLLKGLFGH